MDDAINDQNFGDLFVDNDFGFGERDFRRDHAAAEGIPIGVFLDAGDLQRGPGGKGALVDLELSFPIGGFEGFF